MPRTLFPYDDRDSFIGQYRGFRRALKGRRGGPRRGGQPCRPPRFLADLQTTLEHRGVRPEQIHAESFGPVG